jgi:large subunit ribosomal protein L4
MEGGSNMPKVQVVDMNGAKVNEIELSDSVFGLEPNEVVMHAAVVNYLANQRQGTQSTLTRTEVRGGGRKPWRQKGTGHARQGSIRAPQWRHGGVALGPKPRDYSYSLNKKVKRLALKSALSSKVVDSTLIVVDSLTLDSYKTKAVVNTLKALGADKKALIVMPEVDKKVIKSANNIPGVKTTLVNTLNVYDILNHDNMVVTVDAVKKIEEVYA